MRAQSGGHQVAVANRDVVSAAVSGSLVESGNEEAVVVLVQNEGSDFNEAIMHKVVDKCGDLEAIQEPLVQRARLPVAVSERLVERVSNKLKEYLGKHHEFPADLASDLVMQSRERATLSSVSGDSLDVRQFVQHLYDILRLTSSIMLRALCLGNLSFFQAEMSIKSETAFKKTRANFYSMQGRVGCAQSSIKWHLLTCCTRRFGAHLK